MAWRGYGVHWVGYSESSPSADAMLLRRKLSTVYFGIDPVYANQTFFGFTDHGEKDRPPVCKRFSVSHPVNKD